MYMNDVRNTRANIVIVPTTTSYELEQTPREKVPRKRTSKSTHVTTYSDATYSPKNYLVSGGARAAARDRDEQLVQLNRAAVKDLRNANTALADELARTRAACQQDLDSMKQDLATYAADFKSEQDKVAAVRQELAATAAALQHAEGHYRSRMKEMQRRLRDEHTLRHNIEAELQSVKSQLASHKEQLHDAVTGRANAAQLSQELHQEQSMHSELKSQLAVLHSRLQHETDAKEHHLQRCNDLDARVNKLSSRNDSLVDELRQQDAEAATANGRVSQLEPQLARAEQRAEELRAELQTVRQSCTSLGQQVADLEGATAMHTAQQSEWERCRKDLDKARHDVERLRRALERSDAEKRDQQQKAAAARQALQEADGNLDSARMELTQLRERSDSELTRLGNEYDLKKQSLEDLEGQFRTLKEKLLHSRQESAELRDEVQSLARLKDRVRSLELQLKDAAETREAFSALKSQFIAHHDMLDSTERDLVRKDLKVQELADMLKGVSQRLSEGQRGWEGDRRALEGQLHRAEQSLREAQHTCDQLQERTDSLERSKAGMGVKLAAAQEEAAHLKSDLGSESGQASKLKAQLRTISETHSKELDSKSRMVEDVVAALRNEEAAKLAAQHDEQAARSRIHQLEATLSDASGAKQRAEDAATCTSATLNSLKKKAHAYKKENRTLLTNYDDWLKTLVSERGSIGAGYSSDVSQS